NAAVVFVEYDRSPEAHFPVAIEQAYATARWITEKGHAQGLDASRLAVAGDSVGGNMTAALAILAKQRGDITFVHQSMYYPLTEAGVRTTSVRFNGAIHDFLMLNPLRDTAATTAALEQAIHVLRKALGSDEPTAQ